MSIFDAVFYEFDDLIYVLNDSNGKLKEKHLGYYARKS